MVVSPREGWESPEWRRLIDPVTQQEMLVPDGVDDVRAIEHARRDRANQLRRIRFFVDWGHAYPLWENGTGKYAMEPSDYGISDVLGQRLHQWCRYWEQHCDPFEGWDAPANTQFWLSTGDELVRLTAIEVYDVATVLPEFRRSQT